MLGIFIPASPYLIDFFLGAKYSLSSNVFQIYLASFLLSLYITPVSTILYKLNKEHLFLIMNIFQLVINIGLNLYFIKSYGATGAAMATFGAKLFGFAFVFISIVGLGILNKDKFEQKV